MNRQIKFRGLSISTNKWLYGDLLRNENGDIAITPPFKINMHNECSVLEVHISTIGQCVGLTDANNNEVYEYDIITDGSKRNYVIFYSYINLCFERCPVQHYKSSERDRETFSQPITFENWYKIKRYVIGNIFDNPNLLE